MVLTARTVEARPDTGNRIALHLGQRMEEVAPPFFLISTFSIAAAKTYSPVRLAGKTGDREGNREIQTYTLSSRPARPNANGPLVDSAATTFLAKIEMRAIDDVRPNSRNARTHSKKQIRQIAKSVKRFGFINPILVDGSGMVLAGHGRLEAARLLGITQVPVVVITHLSDAEKRAYVLADNKLAENAGWDRAMLAVELGDLAVMLPEIDLDIGITGFSTGELDSLLLDHAATNAIRSTLSNSQKTVLSPQGVAIFGRCDRASGHRVLCGDARSGGRYGEAQQRRYCCDGHHRSALQCPSQRTCWRARQDHSMPSSPLRQAR